MSLQTILQVLQRYFISTTYWNYR